MLINSEKQLLNFVKYSPTVIIVIIAIVVNILIYTQNKENFEKDLKIYEKNYIETNRIIVKSQVEKVYNDIINEKAELEKDLNEKLKTKINEAYSVVQNIHKNFSYEGKEKVLLLIKEALRNIRFNNGRGYFYIHDMNGINILHPLKPSLENTSIINMKDKRGVFIVQDIIKNLKLHDEYFSELFWNKPNDLNNEYKKITFNKRYKPLNLIIGTGEYLDTFTNNLKDHMIKDHVQKARFGKNGYVFIFDYEGVQLAHIKESYIGKNRIDLEDKNGFKITQGIINKAKKGPGYIQYIGTIMPETGKPAKKVTYVKSVKDWGWVLGAGFYDKELVRYLAEKREELEEVNSQSLKNTMMISIILSIVLLFIASYISKILKKFFDTYNQRIQKEIDENRKKDMMLYQQSKMATMGEMIGNIAHQWRQPLNLISTAASRIKLEDELGILSKDTQDSSLKSILKATTYLSKTIDDFREFFNPNKVEKTILSRSIYESTMQLTSARLSNENIHIIENIEDFEIKTFENELIQAVINIVNNSIDAFKDKKKEDKNFIFFDIKKENTKIIIKIKDTAGGIDEKYLEKVFDAYFTTKHQSQGTGIGLYMTYQIIQKHLDGVIEAKNRYFRYKEESYKGAEFTITLNIN